MMEERGQLPRYYKVDSTGPPFFKTLMMWYKIVINAKGKEAYQGTPDYHIVDIRRQTFLGLEVLIQKNKKKKRKGFPY